MSSFQARGITRLTAWLHIRFITLHRAHTHALCSSACVVCRAANGPFSFTVTDDGPSTLQGCLTVGGLGTGVRVKPLLRLTPNIIELRQYGGQRGVVFLGLEPKGVPAT